MHKYGMYVFSQMQKTEKKREKESGMDLVEIKKIRKGLGYCGVILAKFYYYIA